MNARVKGEEAGVVLSYSIIEVTDWEWLVKRLVNPRYEGVNLKPYTRKREMLLHNLIIWPAERMQEICRQIVTDIDRTFLRTAERYKEEPKRNGSSNTH